LRRLSVGGKGAGGKGGGPTWSTTTRRLLQGTLCACGLRCRKASTFASRVSFPSGLGSACCTILNQLRESEARQGTILNQLRESEARQDTILNQFHESEASIHGRGVTGTQCKVQFYSHFLTLPSPPSSHRSPLSLSRFLISPLSSPLLKQLGRESTLGGCVQIQYVTPGAAET
jgi:hypothetical protein